MGQLEMEVMKKMLAEQIRTNELLAQLLACSQPAAKDQPIKKEVVKRAATKTESSTKQRAARSRSNVRK